MSGFVGIVNTDGAPVDRRRLAAMTGSLRFRGPDGEHTWSEGAVGLGHTLLAATDDAVRERQPATLDGSAWIVADARIDGRDDLRRKLHDHAPGGAVRIGGGRAVPERARLDGATDDELILHAYRAWGERCVDHLLGDFAFAIWDRDTRRLFCARDHVGVKPFFYAAGRGSLVFSNALDAVRMHPTVSGDLDDLSVADFLLFSHNLRPDASAFADVRRLPAGHRLTWTNCGLVVRPYWSPADLETLDEIRYRRDQDYVDRFVEVFGVAIRDRLRTRRVAVSLSGGLDSPFVAATAQAELQRSGAPFSLVGHTLVYDHLIPDEERRYTTIAAEAIGMPVRFMAADDYEPFADCGSVRTRLSEPMDSSYRAMYLDFFRNVAGDARVVLTGADADGLLNELVHERFQTMVRQRHVGALGRDVAAYVSAFRRRPPVGLGALMKRTALRVRVPAMPRWLDAGLVRRLDLETRWRESWITGSGYAGLRPRAMRSIPWWGRMFERQDPQCARQPLEFRYPFMDKRVIDYLLAIPAVPWCTQKRLLRLAATSVLPERTRSRPKSPLRESPLVMHLRGARSGQIERLRPAPMLERYVDRRVLPVIAAALAGNRVHDDIRPFMLNEWLVGLTGAAYEERFEVQSSA